MSGLSDGSDQVAGDYAVVACPCCGCWMEAPGLCSACWTHQRDELPCDQPEEVRSDG